MFSEADHGFFCDARASYNPVAARHAWALTLSFLRTYMHALSDHARTTMLPQRIRTYLLRGLETTPDLLDRLLDDVTDPAVYDRRPDPERFTLREVLAHLADWEVVFQQRLRQTLTEDNPTLIGLDEGNWPWSATTPTPTPPSAGRVSGRAARELLTTLRGLTPAQWERIGTHTEVGPLTWRPRP